MSHSSYQEKHRRYYNAHRAEILEKEKEKKRWLGYYDQHKEEIKRRRLARKQREVANATMTMAETTDGGILRMFIPYPPSDTN